MGCIIARVSKNKTKQSETNTPRANGSNFSFISPLFLGNSCGQCGIKWSLSDFHR